MDLNGLSTNVRALWEERPITVLLLLIGFAVFVFIVVDTWRQKRHRKKPR